MSICFLLALYRWTIAASSTPGKIFNLHPPPPPGSKGLARGYREKKCPGRPKWKGGNPGQWRQRMSKSGGMRLSFGYSWSGRGANQNFSASKQSFFPFRAQLTTGGGGGVAEISQPRISHFPFRAELTTGEGVLIRIYQPRKQSFFPFVQNSRPKLQIHSFSFISLNVWGGGGVNLLHLNLGGGWGGKYRRLPPKPSPNDV